jgi:small redox-active disulfide protein 2
MRIEILGSGCPSCHQLFELTKKAAKELGLKDEVVYTDDISKIIAMGVMQVPVLAIDGKPIMTGTTNDIEKIKHFLTHHDQDETPATGKGGCSCGGKC